MRPLRPGPAGPARPRAPAAPLALALALALLGLAGRCNGQQPYVGEIRRFAGNFAPAGWAFCDGSLLSIADHDTLFNLIGTTFGGDGRNTFALPDLRGRVPIHQGQGPGLSPATMGEAAGAETVTLTVSEMPPHSHTFDTPSPVGFPFTLPGNTVLGRIPAASLSHSHTATATMTANATSHTHTFAVPGHTHTVTAGSVQASPSAAPDDVTLTGTAECAPQPVKTPANGDRYAGCTYQTTQQAAPTAQTLSTATSDPAGGGRQATGADGATVTVTPAVNLQSGGSATQSVYSDAPTPVSPATRTASSATLTAGGTGGSQPHDNMQPYLVVNYIISLYGVFPSQS